MRKRLQIFILYCWKIFPVKMLGRRLKALCVIAGVATCVYLVWRSSQDNMAEHIGIRDNTDDNKLFVTYDTADIRGEYEVRRKEWNALIDARSTKKRQHRLPDVIVIGVRKCGTGALRKFMQFHPLLRVRPTEAHFFDRHYDKGMEYYKKMLPNATDKELIVEKTPAYFVTMPYDLPNQIRTATPDVKLILLLCDPVKRAFSDFAQRLENKDRKVKGKKFGQYMKDYFTPVKEYFRKHFFLSKHYKVPNLVKKMNSLMPAQGFAYGVYEYFLERWTLVFPPNQLLVLNGDKLLVNPGQVFERVQDFIGVKKLLRENDFVQNPLTGLYCLRPWWNSTYDFNAEIVGKASWHKQLACAEKTKGRTKSHKPKYHLSPQHAKTLKEFYEPYNEMLFKMLNERFDW